MTLAIGMSDESNFSCDQKDRVSLAHSLPMEMVETILQHLSVPELLVAAAHLPKWWQTVCQDSPEIWRKLARYQYDEEVNILLNRAGKYVAPPQQGKKLAKKSERTFFILLRKDMLFVHHNPRGGGYIYAPGKDHTSLRIIDPDTKNPWYRILGRLDSLAFELYDLDGARVCDEWVNRETKLHLSQFFQ